MFAKRIIRFLTALIGVSACCGFTPSKNYDVFPQKTVRHDLLPKLSLYRHPSTSRKIESSSMSLSSSSTPIKDSKPTVSISRSVPPMMDDASFQEYSRCLSPQEEYDQINSELAFSDVSLWKRITTRELPRKIVKRMKRILRVSKTRNPGTLILVRGGESEFSKNYTFTGWADPDLVEEGKMQMEHCSRLLYEAGYADIVDVVYTSRLKRAIKSTWIILQEISAPFIPMYKSWRLNERHYGSLQGLCKSETANKLGADLVQKWRRSLKARPPSIDINDMYYPGNDSKYSDLLPEQIPTSESLDDCMSRIIPLWKFKIRRDLQRGKNVMVVAHANTIRGITKIIDDVSDDEISDVLFPKGIPFVYKFDSNMDPIKPSEKDLIQCHTNGTFLENPKLLEKAMKLEKALDDKIPGSRGLNLPDVTKRATTLEKALLKLHEEQETWSKSDSEDRNIIAEELSQSMNANKEHHKDLENERFEEDLNPSSLTEDVEVNWSYNFNNKDPIVVFVRHGRTPHNKLKLFTGWEDAPLAIEGVDDARAAGRLLKDHGFHFDVVYSSWLYRAIQTAWYILEEMDLLWIPLIQSWRLNERHYGDLTGKSKKMVANIYGEDQLKKWRRGYKIKPPPVSSYSFNYPGNDKRRTKYVSDLRISLTETFCRSIENRKLTFHRKFPKSESLKDCMDRSIPFYTQRIIPEAIAKNKKVLITSHENAIRGILMELCEIPESCMNDLHLPNGVPLVYNVKRKCISLLDDGSNDDPLEKYDFGSAAQYLFRPCELEEDDFM